MDVNMTHDNAVNDMNVICDVENNENDLELLNTRTTSSMYEDCKEDTAVTCNDTEENETQREHVDEEALHSNLVEGDSDEITKCQRQMEDGVEEDEGETSASGMGQLESDEKTNYFNFVSKCLKKPKTDKEKRDDIFRFNGKRVTLEMIVDAMTDIQSRGVSCTLEEIISTLRVRHTVCHNNDKLVQEVTDKMLCAEEVNVVSSNQNVYTMLPPLEVTRGLVNAFRSRYRGVLKARRRRARLFNGGRTSDRLRGVERRNFLEGYYGRARAVPYGELKGRRSARGLSD